ncbi:MAG: polysaccharide deacetylase family protein [Oscillatoriales cyanobacterium RM2_1_1]|nr:polysaccharide deacetylase family protein [Oscillatoriales cyanobacterium SM2_3_0]NJO44617.1 polysaccharide deacetylase family protein [Oscillatoriales cyanobacterium RM2_1_1]
MVQYYSKLFNRQRQRLVGIGIVAAVISFALGLFLPITHRVDGRVRPLPQEVSALADQSGVQQLIQKQTQSNAQATSWPQIKSVSEISGMGASINQQIQTISSAVSQLEQQRFSISIPERFKGKTVRSVNLAPDQKVIALTFDDGPWPKTTPQILKTLKQNEIKATFFWVGAALENHPDIGQQVVAEGHVIANHTWHHRYKPMSSATAAKEVESLADLIDQLTGLETSLFRPPGGVENNGLVEYVHSQDYVNVMWSIDSRDWSKISAAQIEKNILNAVKPGQIVLMHDGGGNRSATAKALPKIIAELKRQGYEFVTVPELLQLADQEATRQTQAAPPSNPEKSAE